MICRRGHITRNEIGAIRIGQHESWFQIPRAIAPKFAETLERTFASDDEQDAIVIAESAEGPRIEARNNRKHGSPRVQAKPFRKGDGGKPWSGPKRDKKPGASRSDDKASAGKGFPRKSRAVKAKSERNTKPARPWKKSPKDTKRR